MNINVTVDGVTLDSVIGESFGGYDSEGEARPGGPITLREAVVDQIADKLVDAHGRGYDLQRVVQDERKAVIHERLAPIVDTAMKGTLRLTNTYGEPTGPEVTMRDLVVGEVQKYLSERVDDRGNPGRYGNDTSGTRMQHLIRTTVASVIQQELADEVAAAKAALKEQLQQVAAAKLAEAVQA